LNSLWQLFLVVAGAAIAEFSSWIRDRRRRQWAVKDSQRQRQWEIRDAQERRMWDVRDRRLVRQEQYQREKAVEPIRHFLQTTQNLVFHDWLRIQAPGIADLLASQSTGLTPLIFEEWLRESRSVESIVLAVDDKELKQAYYSMRNSVMVLSDKENRGEKITFGDLDSATREPVARMHRCLWRLDTSLAGWETDGNQQCVP